LLKIYVDGTKGMKNSRLYLICLVLSVITIATYWQVLHFDFTYFDDPKYVTENPNVQQGLAWDSIRWAFTTGHASNWHPLTWLSLMLDVELFGLNAGAFHMVNLLLHVANTILLFILLNRCTQSLWPSTFVAIGFALHPLHVESVVWIAERKDVLSALFWMLTTLAYVRYAEQPSISRYITVFSAMALGLMAKPMLVTLPCVLLLLDYWPLRRMELGHCTVDKDIGVNRSSSLGCRKTPFFLVLEKSPLFALAVASSIVTLIVQKRTVMSMETFSLKARVTNALVSYATYIAKVFLPVRLAIFYPHRGDTLPAWQVAFAVVVLVSISTWVILCGRKRRYLVVGWLWYLGTLLPVIGLVQVSTQAMADRYTYLPLTGLFIMIAWSARDFAAQWRYRRTIFTATGFMLCAALMCGSWMQIRYWRNSITLFEHALDVTSNNYLAHYGLGVALAEDGKTKQAIEHYKAALSLKPDFTDVRFNLAKALAEQGKIRQAIPHYNEVLKSKPGDPDVYNSLGLALAEHGDLAQAVRVYRSGLGFNPKNAHLHSNLGVALLQQGQLDKAFNELQVALDLLPVSETHNNMGMLLASQDKLVEAIKHYNKAIRLDPSNAKAYCNLGNAFFAQNKLNEADASYRRAISIKPNYAKALSNLAVVLSQQGKLDEAIYYFTEAVRTEPGDVEVRCNLGDALLEKGQIERAAKEYRKALKIDAGHPRANQGLKNAEERSNTGKETKTSDDSP
jgi:tetratricopeptide (TPR) repeat protein